MDGEGTGDLGKEEGGPCCAAEVGTPSLLSFLCPQTPPNLPAKPPTSLPVRASRRWHESFAKALWQWWCGEGSLQLGGLRGRAPHKAHKSGVLLLAAAQLELRLWQAWLSVACMALTVALTARPVSWPALCQSALPRPALRSSPPCCLKYIFSLLLLGGCTGAVGVAVTIRRF